MLLFLLQYTQKGVGVAILISTDGIKIISPDGQVILTTDSSSYANAVYS